MRKKYIYTILLTFLCSWFTNAYGQNIVASVVQRENSTTLDLYGILDNTNPNITEIRYMWLLDGTNILEEPCINGNMTYTVSGFGYHYFQLVVR